MRRSVAQATRQTFSFSQSLRAQAQAPGGCRVVEQAGPEATQLGYKVGVRVNLDVLNAQAQLFSTQRDLARARYDSIVMGPAAPGLGPAARRGHLRREWPAGWRQLLRHPTSPLRRGFFMPAHDENRAHAAAAVARQILDFERPVPPELAGELTRHSSSAGPAN